MSSNTTNPSYLGSRSMTHKWSEFVLSHLGKDLGQTGISKDWLIEVGKASVETPKDFQIHERLSRTHVAAWLKAIESNQIDWATAEAMAMGSLV